MNIGFTSTAISSKSIVCCVFFASIRASTETKVTPYGAAYVPAQVAIKVSVVTCVKVVLKQKKIVKRKM
jgi:hypothetical protein